MAGYWLKLYTEILDDPKYFRLSDNAKLGMIELMIVAKRVDNDGELPGIEDIAFYTRREVDWWKPVIEELSKIEYLVKNNNKIVIRKFSERQAPVDDAERMRRYREKKHRDELNNNCYDGVTNRNGDSDSDSDSDSYSEKETEKSVRPIQRMIEQITGKPATGFKDIQAMDELEKAGVTKEDIQAGYDWYTSQGNTFNYYSSIVKPSIRCMNERLQESHKPKKKVGVLADGTIVYE